MVLHAMNSAQQSTVAHRARATISLSLVTSVLATCLLQFAAKQVLSVFGSSYEEATWALRILVLAAFPLIVKNHYISICRIHDRIKNALLVIAPGCFLELGAASLGAHFGGLSGLSIGWVIATYIETMFMLRIVYKAVLPSEKFAVSTELQYAESQALWLMDTTPLPIISQSYMVAEALWHTNTFSLPIVRLPAIGQANREPNRNKQFLQDRANLGDNGSRQPLQPSRLQPHTPHPGRIPITDSSVNSQFLERIPDNSTIFEDEVI
jgi:hypothetical protein